MQTSPELTDDRVRIGASEDDLTGRDRLAWNAVASWASHLVLIAAGFLMPRAIDRHMGQIALGIWDFGWTAVNYFFLVQFGVGVSVNRYVARYRAVGDANGLGRLVSSALLLQVGAALSAGVLAVASAWWLPSLFHAQLGAQQMVARWVIALLGASIAVRILFQAFGGVVTGCHRWDLHNLLNAVAYGLTVVAMLCVVLAGGDLVAIAAVYLLGAVANELARVALAFRVCPELRVSARRARWSEARALLGFGAKLSTISVVRVAVAQLTNVVVLSEIGVGMLAVYSRLGALLRHTDNIAARYNLMLTPTASSLQRSGRSDEVRALLVESTRFTAYLTWPILIALAGCGTAIVNLWMGPRYEPGLVLATMSIGAMLPLSQQPLGHVLVGLNLHGRYAALTSVASFLGLIASIVAVRVFHGGLGHLVLAAVAASNVGALCVAIDTCRRLSIDVRRYFVAAYRGPVACVAPFAVAVAAAARAFAGQPTSVLGAVAVLAVLMLLPLYWIKVLPAELRGRIQVRIASAFGQLFVVRKAECR